jgi:predicted dinucleotide-utilizing enzyme
MKRIAILGCGNIGTIPSPDNPRTSYLAALSVLALIENRDRPIRVGS